MSRQERDILALGEKLSAYLDGELSGKQRAEVEALLKSDTEARALLADLEQAAQAVGALPREAAPPAILEGITSHLERAELLGEADRNVTLARHKTRPLRSTIAVAAMLGIAIGGGVYVSSRLAETESASSTQLVRSEPSKLELQSMTDRNRAFHEEKAKIEDALIGLSTIGGAVEAPAGEDVDRLAGAPPEVVAPLAFAAKPATTADVETSEAPSDPLDLLFAQLDSDDVVVRRGRDAKRAMSRSSSTEAEGAAGTIVVAPTHANHGKSKKAVPDSRTLEQKLAAGERFEAVRTHAFDNEPLRLQVVLANTQAQDRVAENLCQILSTQRIDSLDRLPQAGDFLSGRDLSEILGSGFATSGSPADRQAYFEGKADKNFVPASPNVRQYLVRLPADAMVGLIEKAVDDGAQVQLTLGGIRAEDRAAACRLANDLAVEEEVEAPIAEGDRELPAFDLADVLEQLGLVLPVVFDVFGEDDMVVGSGRPIAPVAPSEEKDVALVTLVVELAVVESHAERSTIGVVNDQE